MREPPFQFDHIIAQFHDGPTDAENLAYACFHCNSFKGPNVAGVDPATGALANSVRPERWWGAAEGDDTGTIPCCHTIVTGTRGFFLVQ